MTLIYHIESEEMLIMDHYGRRNLETDRTIPEAFDEHPSSDQDNVFIGYEVDRCALWSGKMYSCFHKYDVQCLNSLRLVSVTCNSSEASGMWFHWRIAFESRRVFAKAGSRWTLAQSHYKCSPSLDMGVSRLKLGRGP